MRLFVLCGLVFLCSAANATPAAVPAADAPPLSIAMEGGFVDIDVPAELVSSDATSLVIHARGYTNGGPIDLTVRYFDLKEPKGELPISFGKMEIKCNGSGDPLLMVLAVAWQQKPKPRHMRSAITAPAAILGRDAGGIRAKAFFNGGAAELFINWNPVKKVLEIHEKDPSYRAGVLAALSK